MGESATSLFRRGMISPKAAYAKPGILKQTKPGVPLEMADFMDKGGRNDQGGVRDAGDRSVASTRHIDTRQDKGSPARASGKPSKGGSAGAEVQPTRRRAIDEASLQRPAFPGGGKVRASEARRTVNKRSKGGVERSGGYYGGGGQDTQ